MDNELGLEKFIKDEILHFSVNGSMAVLDIVTILGVTFLMGMFIFYIYKKTFQGVLYTQSYNVSLVMISLVTALIIMAISSNFILSLGMVGALSIVRFRTAVKDSMDIVFMFWAISIGITNGAGFFKISFIGMIVVSAVLLLLTKMKSKSSPYLLIINYTEDKHINIMDYLKNKVGKFNLKSKTVANNLVELTIEIRIDNTDTSFVNELSKSEGITNAVLISYNGDYVS